MWKKLDNLVPGPRCEINEQGEVRQKLDIIRGAELRDVIRMPTINKKGYKIMNFRGLDMQKTCHIHMLVARLFVKNPKNYRFVRFINGDKLNTSSDNLEWVNKRPNINIPHKCKLSSREVSYIRTMAVRGIPQVKLASQFRVSPSLICHIIAGRKR